MPNDDLTLLREYARTHSESAFATLVGRHVNLVYSVALRQVGNPDLAQEISHAVFIILARKANQLGAGVVLPGWLCRTARHVGARALRDEARRRRREQEAGMESRQANESETEDVWAQIGPLLGEAMGHLNKKDYDALVLRFFQNKNFAEVGTALGASEDAAKMQVSRGLEKLRRFFGKKGIACSAGAIAEGVAAHSVGAAPPGLATQISVVAAGQGAAATASTLTLVKGALKIMAWSKVKTAVVAVSALLLVGAAPVVIHQASLIQGQTEKEWIKSIVYRGDDQQRLRWHALGARGVHMLLRAMKPPAAGLSEAQAIASRDTRMRAACLLSELADFYDVKEAVPGVIQLLKAEKDDSVRGLELSFFEIPIRDMVAKEKAALLPELVLSLDGHNISERNNALVALQYYSEQKERVVPLVVHALHDSNSLVRVAAVRTLNAIDPQNSESSNLVSVLADCVTSPSADAPSAPNEAVTMLGELRRDPDVAVPALMRALQGSEYYIRQNAAAALGKFGLQAAAAVPALTKALEDTNPEFASRPPPRSNVYNRHRRPGRPGKTANQTLPFGKIRLASSGRPFLHPWTGRSELIHFHANGLPSGRLRNAGDRAEGCYAWRSLGPCATVWHCWIVLLEYNLLRFLASRAFSRLIGIKS